MKENLQIKNMIKVCLLIFFICATKTIIGQINDDVIEFNYSGSIYRSLFRTRNWSNDTTAEYYIGYRNKCTELIDRNSIYWKKDSLLLNGFRRLFVEKIKYCFIDSTLDKNFILKKLGKPIKDKDSMIVYKFFRQTLYEKKKLTFLQEGFITFFLGHKNLIERISIKFSEPSYYD
ncbi:MAG: hypothetical protein ACK56P_14390 [Chitinophagales bacterium]